MGAEPLGIVPMSHFEGGGIKGQIQMSPDTRQRIGFDFITEGFFWVAAREREREMGERANKTTKHEKKKKSSPMQEGGARWVTRRFVGQSADWLLAPPLVFCFFIVFLSWDLKTSPGIIVVAHENVPSYPAPPSEIIQPLSGSCGV